MYRELFDYEPETGLLRWKVSRSSRIKVGQVAGSVSVRHACRYRQVRVGRKSLYAHRVIYELVLGHAIPAGFEIDHVNGDGLDNRWANLRLATRSQNMGNTRGRRRDLPKGIHKRGWGYTAELAGTYIGCFKSPAAAKAAYDAAAAQHFGEFARP